ncbi:MAG: YbaB/EbfC family nucleoid-associated protein [bacterium]|nr:YbaB/EbfC family nucleoid-associated protein [bacterium]
MAFDKMKQAKELNEFRKQAQKIQKELRDTLIEVTEAEGKVKVVFTGEQTLEEVTIDPSLLEAGSKKDLEKYLKSAVSQAIKQSQQVAAQKMQSITGGMGLPGM